MPRRSRNRIIASLTVAASVTALVLATAGPAQAAPTCSSLDVIFAHGTGEAAGFGSVGDPFVASVVKNLSGFSTVSVSTYAVVYDALVDQSSAGAGSTDLVNHLKGVAASCPNTKFVLGGFSQGASVVDLALGIPVGTSTGTAIPSSLAGRVASIVVFGNPLGDAGKSIPTASATYGARSQDYCNVGDPFCSNGTNPAAHTQYISNGSVASGAYFAAYLAAVAVTPPAPTCFTASTLAQVQAGRAVSFYGLALAAGSGDYLGPVSSSRIVSLQQTSSSSYSRVGSC